MSLYLFVSFPFPQHTLSPKIARAESCEWYSTTGEHTGQFLSMQEKWWQSNFLAF
jgi:hypothetical protein